MNSLALGGAARAAALALALAALPLSGCRAPDTSALEAENRMLEDQLYELQDHCQQLHDELESARRANRSEGAGARRSRDSGEEVIPPGIEGAPEFPRSTNETQLPGPSTSDEPYLRSPEEPEAPAFQSPGGATAPPSGLPPFEPESSEVPIPPPQASNEAEPSADPDQVVSITLNRRLTGGHDTHGDRGDDGVMVVVEPRTADGRIVPVDGALTIGVQDPEQPADQGEIARWDFSPEESARFFRRTPMGNGLHFDLPWPADPPEIDQVRLWVRMTTPEGKRLAAQRTVRCDRALPVEAANFEEPAAEPIERQPPAKPAWAPERP